MDRAKKEGGLGFKDVEGFNLSLLGKQRWRIATKESSLLAMVLKGKYFSHCSPLEAAIGTRPSFGWRSLHGSQELMRLGMKKELGNGSDLCFLQDPWLATDPPRPPIPRFEFDPGSFNLHYFKDPFSNQWNISRLTEDFGVDETKLSSWRLKAPPKIKHLLWRSISNCLAVGRNMKKKRLTRNGDCPRCFEKSESEKARFLIWPWILWFIWKRRNDFTFSGLECMADEVFKQAQEAAEEWLAANSNLDHTKVVLAGLLEITKVLLNTMVQSVSLGYYLPYMWKQLRWCGQ